MCVSSCRINERDQFAVYVFLESFKLLLKKSARDLVHGCVVFYMQQGHYLRNDFAACIDAVAAPGRECEND